MVVEIVVNGHSFLINIEWTLPFVQLQFLSTTIELISPLELDLSCPLRFIVKKYFANDQLIVFDQWFAIDLPYKPYYFMIQLLHFPSATYE